jgi:hypothetical protein
VAYLLVEALTETSVGQREKNSKESISFAPFMKRNKNLTLRKLEELSHARTKGLSKGAVAANFNLLVTVFVR